MRRDEHGANRTSAMTEDFHLGDVLSITTGCLVSPDHIGGVYRILNFMLDDDLFTHQLPRASDECKPFLLQQHPQLAEIRPPQEFRDEAHVWSWLAEQVDRYGAYLAVAPVREPVHRDPLQELEEIAPGKPVVVVEVKEDDDA